MGLPDMQWFAQSSLQLRIYNWPFPSGEVDSILALCIKSSGVPQQRPLSRSGSGNPNLTTDWSQPFSARTASVMA